MALPHAPVVRGANVTPADIINELVARGEYFAHKQAVHDKQQERRRKARALDSLREIENEFAFLLSLMFQAHAAYSGVLESDWYESEMDKTNGLSYYDQQQMSDSLVKQVEDVVTETIGFQVLHQATRTKDLCAQYVAEHPGFSVVPAWKNALREKKLYHPVLLARVIYYGTWLPLDKDFFSDYGIVFPDAPRQETKQEVYYGYNRW